VTTLATATAYAPPLNTPAGLAAAANGTLYVVSKATNSVDEIAPSSGKITVVASGFTAAQAVAVDKADNLYVTDSSAGTVTKITPSGKSSIIAKVIAGAAGMAFNSSGNLYVAGNTGTTTPTGSITEITPSGKSAAIAVFSGTPSAGAVRLIESGKFAAIFERLIVPTVIENEVFAVDD
jgi:hypothetical protein